jgi:hypothetical protein
MKVILNVEGCKRHFCKVSNHNLRAYFLWAYNDSLDLMNALTCGRSNTSKTLNLLNIFKSRFLGDYLYVY